jgi:hypothetical protein
VCINPRKTRIVHVRHGFEFLGYKIKRGSRPMRLPDGRIKVARRPGRCTQCRAASDRLDFCRTGRGLIVEFVECGYGDVGDAGADAVKTLAAERDGYAARMRRQVVLKGLASLGHQLNESLETAWVRAGQLVIERPSQPGYGVELGGMGDKGGFRLGWLRFELPMPPLIKLGMLMPSSFGALTSPIWDSNSPRPAPTSFWRKRCGRAQCR